MITHSLVIGVIVIVVWLQIACVIFGMWFRK